jgi:hypothetical protein
MQGQSRREFIGGTAALAAGLALPLTQRPGVTVSPIAGTTVNLGAYGVGTFLEAAQIYDGYVGLPLATTFEKVYMNHGQFGPGLPSKMAELAPSGCEFLISVKPSNSRTTSQQKAMAAWLALLKAKGIRFRMVLYSEPNDKAFLTAQEWLPYWRYYAPVIKDAGATLCYEPGCGGTTVVNRAIALFPSNPTPDELWFDYYCTAYRNGSRVDKLLALAAAAQVPAGIGEWGWMAGSSHATGGHQPTMKIWDEYGAYLIGLIGAKKIQLGAAYFNARFGTLTENVITGPKDPRIPMIRNLVKAVQGA